MKSKLIFAMIVIVLTFWFVSAGCEGDTGGLADRERVTVTFKIGFAGGKSPEPIILIKGTAADDKWPRNPSRTARPGYSFDGWKSGSQKFTRSTVIEADITVTGQWKEEKTEESNVVEQPSTEVIGELFDPAIPDPANPANKFPEQLSDARKIWGMMSPAITFAYTADPTPMVFCHREEGGPCIRDSGHTESNWCDDCTLYIYGSNDTLGFTSSGGIDTDNFDRTIQGLRIISTRDLVNWTEHGVINIVGKTSTHALWPYSSADRQITFASNTWAPSAEWKMVNGKPRFFLYFCDSGNATTVLVGDSPVGPFSNPGLTSNMINKNMAIGNGVSWLFDPGTIIDYDGKAYMFLGGDGNNANPGNARRTALSDDMISSTTTDSNIYRVNLPWHFEATDIWKWKGIYYVNYTTNWSSSGNMGFSNIDIVYMMNREGPLEPFPTNNTVWGGPKRILPNSTNGNGNYGDNTNHASLFDFKGKPYMVYHTQSAAQAYGGGRLRGAHITPITIADDGSIAFQNMGVKGAPQVGSLNPYVVQEAETVYITAGVYTKYDKDAENGAVIASIDTGDWMGVWGVDFGEIPSNKRFNAVVKLPVTTEGEEPYVGAIELRINPTQQGVTNPQDNSRLRPGPDTGTNPGIRSRITGGEVIGRMRLQVKDKEDEGKWIIAWADLDEPLTGKHDLVFVFYSSRGASLEHHTATVTPETDARRRNVGFEIDQWWFSEK